MSIKMPSRLKKTSMLSILFMTVRVLIFAQSPPISFDYNAVARDPSGQPISSAPIGIQISIHKTSPSDTTVYVENHVVNTDAYGLFTIHIGEGIPQSGNLNAVNWSNDNYFLGVAMDANGGTNFLQMGTTQLLSVPYAFHAKTAENIIGGIGNNVGFTHYIGEIYGGGVIFHLWKDSQGIEHGLIVDLVYLSSVHIWSNKNQSYIGPAASSSTNGLANSNAIVSQSGHTNSAARLCLNSTNQGESDWYLPAIDELVLLWHSRFIVNKTLSSISNGAQTLIEGQHWSSTEWGSTTALTMGGGIIFPSDKGNHNYFRAIRAF